MQTFQTEVIFRADQSNQKSAAAEKLSNFIRKFEAPYKQFALGNV